MNDDRQPFDWMDWLMVAVCIVAGAGLIYILAGCGGSSTPTIPHLKTVPDNMRTGPRFQHVYCASFPNAPQCQ